MMPGASGMGRGGGRGMGRGGGRGGGRGLGRGGELATSPPDLQPLATPQPQLDLAEELAALKAQVRAMEEQLAALNERIMNS